MGRRHSQPYARTARFFRSFVVGALLDGSEGLHQLYCGAGLYLMKLLGHCAPVSLP